MKVYKLMGSCITTAAMANPTIGQRNNQKEAFTDYLLAGIATVVRRQSTQGKQATRPTRSI